MANSVELLLPENVNAVSFGAAVKITYAVSLVRSQKVKTTVSAQVDKPTLVVTEGERTVSLFDPNAAVKYLLGDTANHSALVELDESELFPVVENNLKLEGALIEKIAGLLPQDSSSADAAILFGDLAALVMVQGRIALSANGEVMLWHQKFMSDQRVKSAILPALQLKFDKPKKQTKVPSSATTAAAAGTAAGASTGATAASASGALPKPVNVPQINGPNVDKTVEMPAEVHPILPNPNKRNVLITSALPYVNNVPHLGNVTGSTLSADFFSRYSKARGYNTLFICGTDEYGTATETKALEENVTPYELCTHYHHVHKAVYDWFEIEFDHFGRTSTEQQTQIAQEMFLQLYHNGFLKEEASTQLYCEKHEGFLADRYVEGECPKCHYPDARGDQCDGCGQLLDPLDLIKPRCKLDDSTPVQRETKHTFLELDKLQPQLEEWLATKLPRWPKNAQTIVQNWLKEGLRPRAITRDLKWGTPVPLPGYEKKVLYVWFDAPIGYPSITANYTADWKKWWKPENPNDIELFQFMGKDNAPFHAVVFPSSELGANDHWKLVDYLSTTEFLNYEGGKFSKSRNVGVFGTDAQKTGISPSVWRYYLASARPETADSQFSWSDFVTRNNSELLANLGNFVNRVVKFTIAKYGGAVPEFTPIGGEVLADFQAKLDAYLKQMEGVHIRDGVDAAMRFSARGNQYLQDSKLDNTLFSEKPEECAQVIGSSLNFIYILSSLIYPFMPDTSKAICEQLNVPLRLIPDQVDFTIKPGHKLGKAQYLFSRIDTAKVDEWLGQFGGGASLDKEIEEEKKKKKEKKESKKKAMKAQAST